MKCPNCGTDLHDGARVCLTCETYLEPTAEERARVVAHLVEHDRELNEAQRLHPLEVEDSMDRVFRSLTRWTWLGLLAVVVLLLYFNGYF